jgi:hypothetical protein
MHGYVKLYDRDQALLTELGLDPRRSVGAEWLDLGTTRVGDASVRIEAMARPAMFFRFTITDLEQGASIVIKTGSGAIHNYWQAVKLFAEGLLWAEPITRGDP